MTAAHECCRICLLKREADVEMISIFDISYCNQPLADLMHELCNIQAEPSDGFPQNICMCCFGEFQTAYGFREKCIRSDQVLRGGAILSNGLVLPPVEEKADGSVVSPDTPSQQECEDSLMGPVYITIEMMRCKCCICLETFYNPEDLREHLQSVHDTSEAVDHTDGDSSLYVCFACRKQFSSEDELQFHQGRNFMELYQCISCDDIFEAVDFVIQHWQQSHSAEIAVESATTMENTEGRGNRHCCVTHCSESFASEQELISHAQSMHSLKLKLNTDKQHADKTVVCNVCFRSFNSLRNLRLHQFVRSGRERQFKCTRCPFRATSKSLVEIHERSHTGDRPYACQSCDKRFCSKLSLKSHQVCHSADRPFVCSVCSRNFLRKRNMEEHMRACHSNEKPYGCEYCDATFKVQQHLRLHRRTHTGEKPYPCSFCPNRYCHISDRKRHEMSHTGEKPYSCGTCGHAFTRKRTLTIHERTHTGERPFPCTLCGKAFGHKIILTRHMIRHQATVKDALPLASLPQSSQSQKAVVEIL